MKTNAVLIAALGLMFQGVATGQGTLVYDQQSASGGLASGGARIASQQPLGQSFTPALSGVGFVQFQFGDFAGNLGATVSVNLREASIMGNVLATTAPVFMSNGYRGTATFYFNNNVLVAPGVTYYFQPTLISGDDTDVMGDLYDYRGGTLYSQGLATLLPA